MMLPVSKQYFVLFLDQNSKRESGRKVQLGNVNAAKVRLNKARSLFITCIYIIVCELMNCTDLLIIHCNNFVVLE